MRVRIFLLSFLALLISGNTALSAESSKPEVRMVYERDLVKGCKYLGKVTGKSTLGGLFGQKWGQANAERELRNKTEEMGGNVVLVHYSEGGFHGARANGDAYLCQAEAGESEAKKASVTESSESDPAKTVPISSPPSVPGGCTKDTDCKGNRICESGKCVNP